MAEVLAPAISLQTAPGVRFRTPLGLLSALRGDPLGLLMRSFQLHGDIVGLNAPLVRLNAVFHPDYVKHVLQDNAENYWKGQVFSRLKRFAGNGILFSEGDFWRRQRRLAVPAFQGQRVAAMAPMMSGCADALVERWLAERPRGEPVDVAADMSKLTLEIVFRALFGSSFDRDLEKITEAVNLGVEYANYLINTLFPLPMAVPTPRNLVARKWKSWFDEKLYDLIAERRRDPAPGRDLLSILIQAKDEDTDEGMDDRQLRDELFTFVNAGHETTGVALAWTWYLLSRHPEVARRLRSELDTVLSGRTPGADDLPQLVYTRCVVDEAMRLYPPAWAVGRESYGEDEIGGCRIEPKTGIFLSPWVTHRHPEFWENPEGFDPDRMSPERARSRPRYAYFPFGGGPRMCIGSQFALNELQLVVATIAQRVKLDLVPGHKVVEDPIFTLRPKYGMQMTVRPL
jgi:cytochrome P450